MFTSLKKWLGPKPEKLATLFKVLTDGSPLWLSLFKADGTFVATNHAGLDLTRLTEAELSGKSLFEIIPKILEKKPEGFLEGIFSGDTISIDVEYLQKSGRVVFLSTAFYPIFEEDREILNFVGIFTDITSFKRSEEALQRTLSNRLETSTQVITSSEYRYRGVVEGSPHWICLIDSDGRILTINLAGLMTLFRSEKEVTGKYLWDFFAPEEKPKIVEGIQKVTKKLRHSFEISIQPHGGNPIIFDCVFNPIIDSDQVVRRFVGMLSDITQRKHAEESLQKSHDLLEQKVLERTSELHSANALLHEEVVTRKAAEKELLKAKEEADRANSAKSDFLANMSHEIRTPMNSILGFTKLLLKTTLTEKQKDYASTVNTSGKTLLALLDEILDLSKIESGKLILESAPFDLKAIVSESVSLFEAKAEEKGILLSCDFTSPPSQHVIGDQTRVKQVLNNLVGNAVKFTSKGRVKITASATIQDQNRILFHAQVEDSGVGISPEHMPMLFKKFSQADSSTTRKFGGTGLGLAITKQLVEAMGGNIDLKSSVGEGSIFFFSIPFICHSDAAEVVSTKVFETTGSLNKASSGAKPLEKTAENRKALILLVEDDPNSREIVINCLEELDYEVQIAVNGKEAVEKISSESFNLVLMDLHMPEMDGYEATKKIRNLEGDKSRVPIIAVTAMAMSNDREKCQKAGMNDFLAKPIDTDKLKEKISALLKKS